MMTGSVLDILIYVFDRYMLDEVPEVPEREHLARDLERAGFTHANVERALDCQSRLEQTQLYAIARGGNFDELQRVRRRARDATRRAGTVSASPRPLQESRDAFRAPDLQHAVDRREIHAQIE